MRNRTLTMLALLTPLFIMLIVTPVLGAASPQPKRLICGHLAEPRDLQPAFSTHMYSQVVSCNFFNSLLMWSQSNELVGDLAKSWDTSSDGKTMTFHLHEGVKWHDGKPFTSADVKFSLEKMVIPYHPAGKSNFAALEAIETPDDNTVVLKLKYPSASLLSILDQKYAPISAPKHLFEGTDIKANPLNYMNPVGTGPFKFKEWKKGDYIAMVKNENYFKKGLPYMDEIVVRFIPERSTMVLALEKGEIDYVVREIPASDAERLQKVQGIKVVAYEYASQDATTLYFNLKHPALSKVEVRQALAHAIDRKPHVEFLFGFSTPAVGFLDYYVKPTFSYDYSVEKANALLDKAGYPRKADGVRFKVRMLGSTGYPERTQSGVILRDQFKAVGVEVEVITIEDAAFMDTVFNRLDFDMAIHGGSHGPDPGLINKIYHSKQIGKGTFTNCMSYVNPELDTLFEEQEKAVDVKQRKEIFSKINDMLMRDLPAIHVVRNLLICAMKSELEGLPSGWSYREPMEQARWAPKVTPTATATTTTAPAPTPTEMPWTLIGAVVAVLVIAGVYMATKRRQTKTK